MTRQLKRKGLKILSVLLTIMIFVTALPLSAIQAVFLDNKSAKEVVETKATNGVSVKIVSFARGDVDPTRKPGGTTTLRSSELLMAKVEGYDGDESKLTYRWTNNLRTYLYIYSKHNMYSATNTANEWEIYNSTYQDPLSKQKEAGRTSANSVEKVGFQYAAVYGANLNDDSFKGGIKVEVLLNGRVIATDIIGDMTKKSKMQSGFKKPDLQKDLGSAVLGIFEGETMSAKDLLGEAGIVHINCTECTAKVKAVSNTSVAVQVNTDKQGNFYNIKGLKEGMTTVTLTVKKENCKFHQRDNDDNIATAKIYVFKKPKTETSATTLTLYDDLRIFDDKPYNNYNYYIFDDDGNRIKGEVTKDPETGKNKIVFTDLTPNTKYEIMVEAPYYEDTDTKHENPMYAYGYVYDTTKNLVNARVNIALDEVNVEAGAVGLDASKLKLHSVISGVDYDLVRKVDSVTGKVYYTAQLGRGTYHIYYDGERLGRQIQLIVDSEDVEETLNYFSVTYNGNGGTNVPPNEQYYIGGTVETSKTVPIKEGWIFKGWKLNNTSTILPADTVITTYIKDPIVLTAQWEKAIDIDVNVVIYHEADNTAGQAQTVDFNLVGITDKDYNRKLTTTSHDGYDLATENYTYKIGESDYVGIKSTYTVQAGKTTYKNLPPDGSYAIDTHKNNYQLESITTTTSENKITYTITYRFKAEYTTMDFNVELSNNLKRLQFEGRTDVVPKSANVKVTVYRRALQADSVGNPTQDLAPYWRTIIEQRDSYTNVPIGADGTGKGQVSIWPFEGNFPTGTDTYQFHFSIKVVSIVYSDGTTVANVEHTGDFDPDNDQRNYVDKNKVYNVTINVEKGKVPDGPLYAGTTTLEGVYYDNVDGKPVQHSTVTAVIDATLYNVKFDTQGGTFSDGTTTKTVNDVYSIPLFRYYIPTREGGYVFRGWYKDKECTQVATAGEIINGNYDVDADNTVTLYAKWESPLTVEGYITVDYEYDYNGEHFVMLKQDRPVSTSVSLQKKSKTKSIWVTVGDPVLAYYDSDIIADETAKSNKAYFKFTGLEALESEIGNPDNAEFEYRIVVNHQNFTTEYTPSDQIAVFDKDEQQSIFGKVCADKVGRADAKLKFVPDTFKIYFEVDDSQVLENVRPQSVKVVYEFIGEGDGNYWDTIVQHTNDDGEGNIVDNPITSTFTGAKATGNDYYVEAWKYSNVTANRTNYKFRLKVVSYTDYLGNEIVLDDSSGGSPLDVVIDNELVYDPSVDKAVLKAHFEPKTTVISLDTKAKDVALSAESFFNMGDTHLKAVDSEGYVYQRNFQYGEKIVKLPTPTRADYEFTGWYEVTFTDDTNYTIATTPTTGEITITDMLSRYFVAGWEEDTKQTEIIFHGNFDKYISDVHTEDVFRLFTTADDSLKIGQPLYVHQSVEEYGIPSYDNNKLIFKGWYYDEEPDKETRPIDWKTVTDVKVGDTVHIYAHWIVIGEVAQEVADGKQVAGGKYVEYDLAGVQIRNKELDPEHQQDTAFAPTGLRFITSLSQRVYNEVVGINKDNTNFEYGYALAKSSTAKNRAGSLDDYELKCKGTNVNGEDTATAYSYVQNVVCNPKPKNHDHYNGTAYRLYTAVITYNGLEGDALTNAHNVEMLARSYIKYTDANGLVRIHYNTYTGGSVLYKGCSTSYTTVLGMATEP